MTETVDHPSARRKGGRAARVERARPVRRDISDNGHVNAWALVPGNPAGRTLVIACGALIVELRRVIELNGWHHIEITGIPAEFHITPERITGAVEAKIRWAREHGYAFYTGLEAFEILHDAEPGTFYLTDFLARHFDALTIRGLAIDKHPELKAAYFGNYTRIVYLAQLPDADRMARAERIAEWFALPLQVVDTGLVGLERFLQPA